MLKYCRSTSNHAAIIASLAYFKYVQKAHISIQLNIVIWSIIQCWITHGIYWMPVSKNHWRQCTVAASDFPLWSCPWPRAVRKFWIKFRIWSIGFIECVECLENVVYFYMTRKSNKAEMESRYFHYKSGIGFEVLYSRERLLWRLLTHTVTKQDDDRDARIL